MKEYFPIQVRKTVRFPVVKIFFGILLINMGTFFLCNTAEGLLHLFDIYSGIFASTFIFVIRISSVLVLYRFFVWIYEKRKPSELPFIREHGGRLFLGLRRDFC